MEHLNIVRDFEELEKTQKAHSCDQVIGLIWNSFL